MNFRFVIFIFLQKGFRCHSVSESQKWDNEQINGLSDGMAMGKSSARIILSATLGSPRLTVY